MTELEDQARLSPHRCADMLHALADPDYPVVYNDRFREYGLRILDGGSAIQLISFCPWSGERLPESLRNAWFDAIEGMGLQPGDDAIPERFTSGSWWRQDRT